MHERVSGILLLLISLWLQSVNCPNAQATPPRLALPQTQTQQQQQQTATAQNEQDVVTLELGKPVVRELAGGQSQRYQIALVKGQHIRVDVKPLSIDLGVSLQLPEGKSLAMYDPYGIKQTLLVIEHVADLSGIYQFKVFTTSKALPGRYEISLAELNAATENDYALQQARDLYQESRQLFRQGKFAEARPLILKGLEIREKILGPDDLKVAELLDHLSISYNKVGDYASAEPLMLRILKIKEKVYGPEHPAVANELLEVGGFYFNKGDFLKAEEVIQKALLMFEKAHQPETLVIAFALSYLGEIYYARSDYEKAESYYRRALAIREKNLGLNHFHLADSLKSLGRVAYDAGDYAKAEAMFTRSLSISEKTFGPDHTQLTWSLNNLALVYATTGDYAKAEAFYRRALSIHEQTGMYAPNVEETLLGLSRLSAARGMLPAAVQFQAQASELEERFVGLNLVVGSEREKLSLLDELSLRESRHVSLHTRFAPDDATARELAVTTILRRKGRVQDALSDSMEALRRRLSTADQSLLDELNASTSRLANIVLNGLQKGSVAEKQQQIKKLTGEREKLEAEVGRRSAGFYAPAQPVTLAAVQALIPDNAALVEFALYRPFDPNKPDKLTAYGAPRYVAYVIRRGRVVQWRELGAAQEIDAAVDGFRQALRDPQRNDVQRIARSLDEKLMRPVRALAGDATHLLVSPDGELNLMPFAALVDERGRYLIERYAFTYLTSGRDLLHMQTARPSKSNPVIIANPSFGEASLAGQIATNTTVKRLNAKNVRRRSVNDARNLSGVYFTPLDGTTQEARSIKSLFADATLLTGEGATEAALKTVAAPEILHIATHGFFLQDLKTIAAGAATATRDGSGDASAQIENPLLRSGLALTGANSRKGGGSDDGILTALEASGLNLWGTKLVVLSACDTGLGEVRNGEGVYGLRRAFVLAGTQSLVMSLWPASDYATKRLMTDYYKNLKGGMGRGAALRQVQLDMLKRNQTLHPFYWANFIQSGEWANLDGRR